MLDIEAQREVFQRVRAAAKRHGLLVAPIGSVYFLRMGEPRLLTKDIDTVLHEADDQIPALETVVAVAEELGGEVQVVEQKSVVIVTLREPGIDEVITIELLRGRNRPGFLNRSLLTRAASLATREDNVLHYPVEFVIVLKAEAAIDRRQRAQRRREAAAKETDTDRRADALAMAERNAARATAFARDVFAQMGATRHRGLDENRFVEALTHVKQSWRASVADLLDAASQGALHLRADPRLFPKR